jgi:hypothetical protein
MSEVTFTGGRALHMRLDVVPKVVIIKFKYPREEREKATVYRIGEVLQVSLRQQSKDLRPHL